MSGLYDATLAPGATMNFAVMGNYVKVRSAPFGNATLKLDGGESFALDEGLGVRLKPEQFFRDVSVQNKSTTAQTIVVFIGSKDATFEDTRITGNVRVIDQGADKTRTGKQFFQAIGKGVDAANSSVVGLRANGASVAIKRLQIVSAAGGTFTLFRGTSPGTSVATPAGLPNKYQGTGAALSVSQSGTGIAASSAMTASEQPGFVAWFSVVITANGSFEMPLTTPLVIDGTNVLGVVSNAINKDVGMNVDIEEL